MVAIEDDDGGSEDVNDFLKRIKELGDRRDREDEERNRRLEEQIVQGRKERQARREALDNATPFHSGDLSLSEENDVPRSRSQISNTLGSKDPSWFKQTPDQGRASAAYQKRQDEDTSDPGSGKTAVNLPGMSGKSGDNHSTAITKSEVDPRTSGDSFPSVDRTSNRCPGKPLSIAHRQTSPEQPHRSLSPTKGLGGFVQSAMLKRSDSAAKKWTAQPQHRLQRGDSIVSNRSDSRLSPSTVVASTARYSRDNTPASSSSRPSSSHANTSTAIEDKSPDFGDPRKSSRPSTPLQSASVMLNVESEAKSNVTARDAKRSSVMTPPTSPTKRWSPQKSSWLENAISKPESPKMFSPPTAPPQPAWMAEITKAKQRGSVELSASSPHKTITPTSLLRSPTIGSPATTPTIGGLSANFGAGKTIIPKSNGPNISKASGEASTLTDDLAHSTLSDSSPFTSSARQSPTSAGRAPSDPGLDADRDLSKTPGSPGAVKLSSQSSKPLTKPKPSLPPQKELSSDARPPLKADRSGDQDNLEFRNAFSKLKRTQTQNYKAPDELKESIMRGKSGLAVTGGPRKSERKDDFRDSILNKKRTMAPPLASTRITSAAQSNAVNTTPEAIRKRVDLGKPLDKTDSIIGNSRKGSDGQSRSVFGNSERLQRPKSIVGESPPTATLPKETNPGLFTSSLSDILQRGPSPGTDATKGIPPITERMPMSIVSRKVSTSEECSESGPQLKHATKVRARGPKRRPPTSKRISTSEAQPHSQSRIVGGEVSSVNASVLSAKSPAPPTQSPSNNGTTPSSRPPTTISIIKSGDRKSSQPVSPRKPSTSVTQHVKPLQAAASERSVKAGTSDVSAGPPHDVL
ncbi:MAG: hypothetical protein OHK93_007088 [Ramalina farinacea]|uniref:DUF4045 domain-containing protein n=1 Tax=Ramalina farinacea TaxID=258253 RepID=A0AA43TV70_9LECA|nr:hypothetical protein [Ramalina farinacea]